MFLLVFSSDHGVIIHLKRDAQPFPTNCSAGRPMPCSSQTLGEGEAAAGRYLITSQLSAGPPRRPPVILPIIYMYITPKRVNTEKINGVPA